VLVGLIHKKWQEGIMDSSLPPDGEGGGFTHSSKKWVDKGL
jgi:hypothetical protein